MLTAKAWFSPSSTGRKVASRQGGLDHQPKAMARRLRQSSRVHWMHGSQYIWNMERPKWIAQKGQSGQKAFPSTTAP
jgi:hypothetical protein